MAYLAVFSTAPSKKIARKITGIILSRKLAACVNIIDGIESHFMWRKKRESAREVLMVIKTRASLYKKLEQTILENHPYEVAEIIAFPVKKGSSAYLRWVSRETL